MDIVVDFGVRIEFRSPRFGPFLEDVAQGHHIVTGLAIDPQVLDRDRATADQGDGRPIVGRILRQVQQVRSRKLRENAARYFFG